MNHNIARLVGRWALIVACSVAGGTALAAPKLRSLTVCADPGNMPLSNMQGEGFENKIAQEIGDALGSGVQYYWRPSIERGLMRTTLSEGNCDLWMDMASDTEGAVLLDKPLYRSTFVFVYRNDKGIDIKSMDDAALKRLRIGVFQVSAIREALANHGVLNNTVVHYLSHNGDEEAANQPSYQVKQVIDGRLDVAAAWGPFAGYYKTVEHAPIVIRPVNLMENEVPMEFDMTLAIPRGRPEIKGAIEAALDERKDQIHKILTDFGVPLVKCEECIISGDLPSHGPYQPAKQEGPTKAQIAKEKAARLADLKKWLAEGANPDNELNDAIVANDIDRVRYLLAHGAHPDARDGDGYTALINATRFDFPDIAAYLADHKAGVNLVDHTQWTALMYAAWQDSPELVSMLVKHGAKLDEVNSDGLTALAIASQNGKAKATEALISAGADVNAAVAQGGYTPLMLAAISGSSDLTTSLLDHGAKINAVNPGGVTALMIAVANNHPTVVAVLLKAGADPNAKSQDGRTARSIAEANNNEALVKALQ
jgi:quinoprotein dehydrogenase-associated probable ABC transporter substrate-binding protein